MLKEHWKVFSVFSMQQNYLLENICEISIDFQSVIAYEYFNSNLNIFMVFHAQFYAVYEENIINSKKVPWSQKESGKDSKNGQWSGVWIFKDVIEKSVVFFVAVVVFNTFISFIDEDENFHFCDRENLSIKMWADQKKENFTLDDSKSNIPILKRKKWKTT